MNEVMTENELRVRDALDRIDKIANIWKVFGNLLNPEDDLNVVGRDDLSYALDFLSCEYDDARSRLAEAFREGRDLRASTERQRVGS